LGQAERLNPEQSGLWLARAMLYAMQRQNEQARDALRKELQYHPGNQAVYLMLAGVEREMGHKDDALATLRKLVDMAPADPSVVAEYATLLFDSKRYGEAVEPLRKALQGSPENDRGQTLLVEALVRGGHKPEGLAELAKMRQRKLDAFTLNSLAWSLVDTNTEPATAKELADLAVADYEEQLKGATISAVSSDHFKTVDSLGATWDTAGWAAFLTGDVTVAEKYIRAAWMLLEHPVAGDHLGQIYERQGKKAEAIHAYQLALAAKSDMPETRQRLEKLGATPGGRPSLRRGKADGPPPVDPEEELSRLRTVPMPELTYRHGSADFFVLFSPSKVEDVQFIRGDEELKGAASALLKARYEAPFPDSGPERIVRRGILSCSEYTKPSCTFVMLLPSNTTN
jgi:tetratricopeptide (TPR) repeat protein